MKNRKKILVGLMLISLSMPTSASALTKSEAIYTNLNYDGSVEKSSVSNHLAFLREQEENDDTTLKDILNINGDEKFRVDGEKIIWENKGRDIFYRGVSEKALPIDVEITYFLNGKKMNPTKMIGKKGEVKISYHFKNKDQKIVLINKRETTLYTPFVISLGMSIEGKDNKDFSINNGKVISTGTRNMIIGLASPGLYDSTHIQNLQQFDDIVLTYSTNHFSLQNTYIVATPKLLSDKDFTSLSQIDNLYQNIEELDHNMEKLVDGAEEVAQGSTIFYDNTKNFSHNMKTIADASIQLKDGSVRLSQGLTTLKNALIQMREKVDTSLQGKSLEEVITSLDNLKTKNNAVMEQVLQKAGKTQEELHTIYVNNQLESYLGTDEKDPLVQVKNAYEMILLFTSNNTAIDISLSTLSSLRQFDTLLSSVEEIETGASTLRDGLTVLESGNEKLYQASLRLETGMRQLMEGSRSLYTGTKGFQEQGIDPLIGYFHTFQNYNNKMEALMELSKNYKGFASNNSDSTLFVYTISSLNEEK